MMDDDAAVDERYLSGADRSYADIAEFFDRWRVEAGGAEIEWLWMEAGIMMLRRVIELRGDPATAYAIARVQAHTARALHPELRIES